ncbi:MAG: UDP-N-acetylmuramate--L-alanine ligase [Candidatus Aminicenantes bacterium]|nr:UDP-N-acetylmuramate--L-alanine ligase [Candidatus Aminicenantes bacterium]MDH5385905.1 UDP-N-acetylmuramate--L-alanine ligase [Candidatus Aminicenantes bacterium]
MVKPTYIKLKNIHLIGIGGTGMNGIAEVLLNIGYVVSGTDIQENEATERLAHLGAKISIGHAAEKVRGVDVVVISSAIQKDNVEVEEARRLKIPVIPRAEMLAELMRMKNGVAVAGSHGKTSTTSMIAQVLEQAGLDPTIIVGGRLNTVGAHAKLGEGDFIVAEADESDRSFLYLSPFIAVLTNLDEEHLDQYETVDEIKKTFINFANKVPFYCPVILCLDDPNLQSLIPMLERRIITYGSSTQADVFSRDHQFETFTSTSTLFWKGEELGKMRLNVPGIHNIHNAMASVAVGLDLNIPISTILQALEKYTGIGRRFELKKRVDNILIIEDYAHHPTEIRATLDAAKKGWACRTIAVFQPHRYSRLSLLMKEFATAFNQADILILTDIYPAGEKSIPGVTGKALYEEIQEFGHKNVYFVKDMENIPDLVAKIALSEDMIFVLGAGDIYKIIPKMIAHLERRK